MANASNFLRTQIGTEFLNIGAATLPTVLYVALFTDSVNAAGTGTEVTGGSYARKQISASSFTDDGVGGFSLNTALEFVTATASWGTIVSMGIYDASGAGNLIVFDDLAATKTIANGDAFRFNSGSIIVNIS
ncbi:MAG TPA: hypothetical protein EYF98_13725 [Planctomycetes bacterium]|jgi:hypothetical protein|nr:hypothetical protein [Planctomycetota bacterium]